ncbi:ROK family protein [Parasalinivibrio latis]|uniref:ROK family protein n=1 Tax=Parasalinivibrio latis TaxID=2952610 RepID=UPI0030E531F4
MIYGFDIGGTKIELVVFNQNSEVVYKKRVSTPKDSYEAFLDALAGLVLDADSELDCQRSIGLSMCGVIDSRSGMLLSANLPQLTGKRLVHDISERLGTNIVLDNDCKCFAYSEANGGAADGYETVFGAILGTGVGGGICHNGELVQGMSGQCGEWGHTQIAAMFTEKYGLPLFDCGCKPEARGCIEQYISGTGLSNIYKHVSGKDGKSEYIISAMRSGDEEALKAFDIFIDILAYSLVTFIHIVNPNAIVFGGGLSNVDELYEKLPGKLDEYLLSVIPAPVLLKPKFGDSSGVRGAALLASR